MFSISNFSWSMLEPIPFLSFEEMRPVMDDKILKTHVQKNLKKINYQSSKLYMVLS